MLCFVCDAVHNAYTIVTVPMGQTEWYVVGGFASIVLSVLTIVKGLVDVLSERFFSGRVDQAAEAGFAVTAATAGVCVIKGSKQEHRDTQTIGATVDVPCCASEHL